MSLICKTGKTTSYLIYAGYIVQGNARIGVFPFRFCMFSPGLHGFALDIPFHSPVQSSENPTLQLIVQP